MRRRWWLLMMLLGGCYLDTQVPAGPDPINPSVLGGAAGGYAAQDIGSGGTLDGGGGGAPGPAVAQDGPGSGGFGAGGSYVPPEPEDPAPEPVDDAGAGGMAGAGGQGPDPYAGVGECPAGTVCQNYGGGLAFCQLPSPRVEPLATGECAGTCPDHEEGGVLWGQMCMRLQGIGGPQECAIRCYL